MAVLLKFILIMALLYFAFKIFYQLVVPKHIRDMISSVRQVAKQMNSTQYANTGYANSKPEGNVTITGNKNKTQKPVKPSEGEYIDYEELD